MLLDVNIRVTRSGTFHFERSEITKALRAGGRMVQQEARRLIARRAISSAGDFPGFDTGVMSRSIKVRTKQKSKVGDMPAVIVAPYKTTEMGDDFYPAYLIYGTKRGLKKRKDFIHSALDNKRHIVRATVRRALIKAIRVK